MRPNQIRILIARSVIATGLLAAAPTVSYSADAPAGEWKAPDRAGRKANPVAADADAIAAGKKVYAGNCLACHGAGGKGDGPAAAALTVKPKNLGDEAVTKQTDGALFWKLTEGRAPMPAYDKTLTETQRWQAIDYVRTFAKK